MAVFILFCVFVYFLSFTKATYISVSTPQQSGDHFNYTLLSDYGYFIDNNKYITFAVKACQDAYIGLMETNSITTALYNIVIGAWGNSKTLLRLMNTRVQQHVGVHLDCGNFRKFNVTWAEKKIELLTINQGSWTKILSYSTSGTTRIKFICVSTSVWADGEWNIFIPETPKESNEAIHPVTWILDKDRKDQTCISPRYRITDHVSCLDCLQQCQMCIDCRYVTYNTTLCVGFSEINSSSIVSHGTSLWVRP